MEKVIVLIGTSKRCWVMLVFVALSIVSSISVGRAATPPAHAPPAPAPTARVFTATPVPSPSAASVPDGHPLPALNATILIVVLIVGAVMIAFIASKPFGDGSTAPKPPVDDKDLERTRIVYGFWLVVAGLLLTLAVLVIILTALVPTDVKTTDIVAVITSTSGTIGTLIAAFFGIQAAGAGRSQALSVLSDRQNLDQQAAMPTTLEPAFGPHAGNTKVSIMGNGLTGAKAVNFGSAEGADFTFVNDGLVRATTKPVAKTVDSCDVSVVFPTPGTVNRAVGTFFYYSVEPATGDVETDVDITGGKSLVGATGVLFGDAASHIDANQNGAIRTKAPAQSDPSITEVDVYVTFPVTSKTSRLLVGRFRYGP